jgi:exopolysaccharide biosynthesis protein
MVALTTTSTAGCDNIGGHPILLNKGIVTPVVRADTYLVKPYARTVIGWTASGETVIMTVDGKDGVSGATAFQLDELLQSLDVVTALDLDGGESTTFFAKGRVLNIPSHGSERPVSTALLVVANS